MDPELKSLLEENLRLSRETNELLKNMNRQAWWSFWLKVVVWGALIIISFWSVQLLMGPYLELLQGTQGTGASFDIENLQNLLDQYKVE